ncbi:MAG: hypothetical protein N3D71_02120 [Burkholderiaceae bacterium]|nr:hypothetical protein [Burkholderiaceae bacterium]
MSRALHVGSVSSHRFAARPSLPLAAAGAVVLSALPLAAVAAWQIDQSAYNAYLCQQVRVAQACMASARTGNFASRAECESARSRGRMGSDWQWLSRTRCVERPDAAAAKSPSAAERSAPRDESTQRDAERFEQQRHELLAKLKMPDRGTPQPPTARSAGALRELQCAAGWALSAARAASLDAARRDAQRSADASGARAGDCPPAPSGPIPIPTPALDDAPPDAAIYREIIEQAQALQSRLAKNREAIEATRARRARTEQALAQLKGKTGAETRDDNAQRRAQEALAAVERLERELTQLDAQLAQAEQEQQQLAGQLEALERKYEAAQARNAPAGAEARK